MAKFENLPRDMTRRVIGSWPQILPQHLFTVETKYGITQQTNNVVTLLHRHDVAAML